MAHFVDGRWVDWSFNRLSCDSVHDLSYYTNWGMSLTRFSHVAPRWDVDHILRSDVASEDLKNRILDSDFVFCRGINVSDRSCRFALREDFFHGSEVRFRRASPFVFFPGSLTGAEGDSFFRIKSFDALAWSLTFGWLLSVFSFYELLLGRVVFVREPLYFHLKFGLNPSDGKSIQSKYFDNNFSFVEHGYSIPAIVEGCC